MLGAQVLEADGNVVAAVRSPDECLALQELQEKHGKALTVVGMDVGVYTSVRVINFLPFYLQRAPRQSTYRWQIRGQGLRPAYCCVLHVPDLECVGFISDSSPSAGADTYRLSSSRRTPRVVACVNFVQSGSR